MGRTLPVTNPSVSNTDEIKDMDHNWSFAVHYWTHDGRCNLQRCSLYADYLTLVLSAAAHRYDSLKIQPVSDFLWDFIHISHVNQMRNRPSNVRNGLFYQRFPLKIAFKFQHTLAGAGEEEVSGFSIPIGLFSVSLYSTCVWKVDNISVWTICRWKRLFIGF